MKRSNSKESTDEKKFSPELGLSSSQYASYLFSSSVADAILPIFYIFLPIFAQKIGATAFELGLVGGSSYAVYSFMPLIMGHFSDRSRSRKFFILTSFVLLAVVSFFYSITLSPITLIITRLFEGTGWAMLWPAMEASISEDSLRDSKKSLGVFNYVWSGGAALGPVIGTLLVSYSFRFAFFASGILFVILIALNGLGFIARRKSHMPGTFAKESSMRSYDSTYSSLSSSIREFFFSQDQKRRMQVWVCLLTTALSASTSGVFFTFFGPYATKDIGLTLFMIGAVTTTYGVIRFFSYVVIAKQMIREKVFGARNRNLVLFASLASLSSLILMIRDPSGTLYFVSFALFAIGYSTVYAIAQFTLIAESVPEQRGASAGLFESSIGIGAAIGPIVAGAISSRSLDFSFIVPAAGLGFVIVILLIVSSRLRPSSGT